MPLEGAAPREVMEDVREADWAPDGETMAIIHEVGGTDRLEFPVGHVLHDSAGYLSDVRVSPDGNLVAFMEHPSRFDDRGTVKVVDRSGKVRELAGGYWGEEGMAWAADGKALYFSGGTGGAMYAVYRTTLDGDARVISDNAGGHDHSRRREGRDLGGIARRHSPSPSVPRRGWRTDMDLSWLDNSLGPVLSPDAKTLLFTDQSEFAGPNYGVAMRPTSGGPIVRLGEGTVEEFSGDGKSVLAMVPSTPPRVVSYPIGVGQSVRLDRGQFENVSDARWLPGETRILVSGNLPGGPARAFLLDPATHDAKPVGADGTWSCFPSPDGKTFIARNKTGWAVFPLEGTGAGTPVPSLTPRDYFIRWNIDGSAVFVSQRGEVPAPVERIELATGKRQTVDDSERGRKRRPRQRDRRLDGGRPAHGRVRRIRLFVGPVHGHASGRIEAVTPPAPGPSEMVRYEHLRVRVARSADAGVRRRSPPDRRPSRPPARARCVPIAGAAVGGPCRPRPR